jgi:arginine/lysine/ornithine decarboxylase
MVQAGKRAVSMRALVVDCGIRGHTAVSHALRALVEELRSRDVFVIESTSPDDGESQLISDPSIQCVMLDWGRDDRPSSRLRTKRLITTVRSRNLHLPIFLVAERGDATSIPEEVLRIVDELIWVLEETPSFIVGRILSAMRRYRDQISPPFMKALMNFSQVYEYSWHTPGHAGGAAFLKSPVGRVFFEYFGENLFRSDLSVSVSELGSLLDHSGPIGESERYAARVFGAHRTYAVTGGTSSSNRTIFSACVTEGDIALIDRNCHKSIEQSLILTGAIPVYLMPSRNHLGLIGPIHPGHMGHEAIKASIASHRLAGQTGGQPMHAIITNSTYDGLCYRVPRVLGVLGESVDRVHFDEAWFGHARFNPLYRGRFGMDGERSQASDPTVFTTTSTHKMLAALSQASFIHVRDGRNPVEHWRFNESFMMHASTSPQYVIIAANEVSAAMMDGAGGLMLTAEAIADAVAFRRELTRMQRQCESRGDWFFRTWNPEHVIDPATGNRVPFEEAPAALLVGEPGCWVLHPGDRWHGFDDIEDGYCMLDPARVSIVTPGIAPDGSMEETGIPAILVSAYLDYRGIIVEKTTDFTMLFLFSIGITKGKWGTLVNTLLKFKEEYDANVPLADALPRLVESRPECYRRMGLRDLGNEMFEQMKDSGQSRLLERAFRELPQPVMTPAQAYRRMVRNEVEPVPLDKLAHRTVAMGVVPYPPGIPLLISGENAGPDDAPCLGYLRALEEWDRWFPEFSHDIHGVENIDGRYTIICLK